MALKFIRKEKTGDIYNYGEGQITKLFIKKFLKMK